MPNPTSTCELEPVLAALRALEGASAQWRELRSSAQAAAGDSGRDAFLRQRAEVITQLPDTMSEFLAQLPSSVTELTVSALRSAADDARLALEGHPDHPLPILLTPMGWREEQPTHIEVIANGLRETLVRKGGLSREKLQTAA